MKKFESLYKTILEQQQQAVAEQPVQQQAPAPQPAPNAVNASDPAEAQEADEGLTVEGQIHLVQLILKALAVDPSTIPDQEKGIFNTKVNAENMEEVLDSIMNYLQ
jgi:hypothetical protein